MSLPCRNDHAGSTVYLDPANQHTIKTLPPAAGSGSMGLLDKTNPRATRASVLRHALLFALLSVLLITGVAWCRGVPAIYFPAIAVASAVFGAFVGGLMEWQLDDGDDDDPQE